MCSTTINQRVIIVSQIIYPSCRHLRAIWNLADNDKDGKLTAEEFAVAMYIINQCNTTRNTPPATLPADLIPPSQRPR